MKSRFFFVAFVVVVAAFLFFLFFIGVGHAQPVQVQRHQDAAIADEKNLAMLGMIHHRAVNVALHVDVGADAVTVMGSGNYDVNPKYGSVDAGCVQGVVENNLVNPDNTDIVPINSNIVNAVKLVGVVPHVRNDVDGIVDDLGGVA